MRAVRISLMAAFLAATLLALGAGTVAAQPPQAGCVAKIVHSFIGPPGLAQAEHRFAQFGSWVSHVATTRSASFEGCFEAFLEGELEPTR